MVGEDGVREVSRREDRGDGVRGESRWVVVE